MPPHRIAVVGAGFAGIALCWELLTHPHVEVTLFDQAPIGTTTSGISSGMLHPYPGKRALKSWRADEGLAATRRLLEIASEATGGPVYQASGILRFPANEEQRLHFEKCARDHSDAEWWDSDRCRKILPGSLAWGGLFIRTGLTVNCAAYLNGLWRACADKGARFVEGRILSLTQFGDFDLILIATGAAAEELTGPIEPAIRPVKGRLLKLRWPNGLVPPPMIITCQHHLVMGPEKGTCLIGATYEHPPFTQELTFEEVRATLLSNLGRLYPQLLTAEILDCCTGVRAVLPSHSSPTLIQIDEKVWRFAGLGSKGLLDHALLAKEQVAHLLALR
jgi:glycine/D-amino acid oxidase-like deaminating enzyme